MFSVRNTQKLVEIYNNRLLQSTKLVKNEKMIQKKDKFFFRFMPHTKVRTEKLRKSLRLTLSTQLKSEPFNNTNFFSDSIKAVN